MKDFPVDDRALVEADHYKQQFARCPVALDTLPVAVQKHMQGIVPAGSA